MRKYKSGAFFPIAYAPAELTVLVSNALWVLQKLGQEQTYEYGALLLVRFVLFVTFRGLALPFVIWYSLSRPISSPKEKEADEASTTIGDRTWYFWQEYRKMNAVLQTGIVVNVSV